MTDGIQFSTVGRVGVITLDRPHRKNAFTFEMIDEWARFLQHASGDPQIGAIVLTGAGDSFCSGVDLDVLRQQPRTTASYKSLLSERIHQVAFALETTSKPVIAAINGVAVGAGLDMALMCDMRFASASATMSEGYIKLGLVPGDGGCYFLPRLVGPAKALELLLTGDTIDAAEAHRIGMVNRVYPDAELVDATIAFAQALAEQPELPIGMIKRAVQQSMRSDLRTSLDLISSHFGIVAMTESVQKTLGTLPGQSNDRGGS